MKSITCVLFILILSLHASQPALMTVKQPVYWTYASEGDGGIRIVDVLVATGAIQAEGPFNAISLPNKPAAVNTVIPPADINLASLYGIKVTAEQPEAMVLKVTIDASNAKVPADHPFSIAQVIDATATCVKLMNPAKPESVQKFELKVVEPEMKK